MTDKQIDRQKRQPRRQPECAAALVCGNEVTGFQIANRGSQRDAAVCRLCRSHCLSLARETDRGRLFSLSDTADSGPTQRYKTGLRQISNTQAAMFTRVLCYGKANNRLGLGNVTKISWHYVCMYFIFGSVTNI